MKALIFTNTKRQANLTAITHAKMPFLNICLQVKIIGSVKIKGGNFGGFNAIDRQMANVIMKTKLCAVDERWFYIEQTMWVKGKCTCHALLRTAVTNIKTGKTIDTKTVLSALNLSQINIPPDEWVQSWVNADKLRPYPNE